MKSIKILGLAAVLAMAAMAFIGGSSASAVTLCKVNTNPCPTESRIPVGETLKSQLNGGVAKLTGLLNEECSSSTVEGATETNTGSSLDGKITATTFTNCQECEKIEALPPWTFHLTATSSGNGTLTILTPEVHLINCTFFGIDCTVSASTVVLDVTGGSPALVKAVNEPLEGGGFCDGNWTATYKLTAPNAGTGWVEASP